MLNSYENEYSKFATNKWYVIDSESAGGYSHHDPIKFSTKSIEWSLCDYSDEYILDTGGIAVPAGSPAGTQLQIKAILHCSYTSTI